MKSLIGAALLAAGRPLRAAELGKLLDMSEAQARAQIEAYAADLARAELGFLVEEVAGGFRLVVPPALAQQLAPLLSPPPLPGLSGAALEVLAVIAYRQPVTRAEIEAMRGGSASTVITLQERELIKVVGRADAVGQPLLYATTERFLLEFGLRDVRDLPPLQAEGAEFSQLLRG
ncbi:SMC-Scp complex subunit ScpB [Deinococcus rubellus]